MENTSEIHTYRFPKNSTIEAAEEQILNSVQGSENGKAQLFVATNYKSGIFDDTWISIAIGTILRNYKERATARVWGVSKNHKLGLQNFTTTTPGLVSTFLAPLLTWDDSTEKISVEAIRDWIENDRRGYLDSDSAEQRTIVEVDENRADQILKLTDSRHVVDEKVFAQLILNIRKDLEVWWENANSNQSTSHALYTLSEFIKELFENAYKHGQIGDNLVRAMFPQLRYLRFRKHIAFNQEQIESKVKNSPPVLLQYVRDALSKKKKKTLIEVSISDFGLGILDYFLSSPTGEKYKHSERQRVLHKLLYENLSSNALDPAAGLGIPKALIAAKELGAFVSLRTGEFWYCKSFAKSTAGYELDLMNTTDFGPVHGTHWQFLWAPPY